MTTTPGAAQVPDKPALEGLEDKWAEVWEAAGRLPLPRRRGRPRGRLLHRHPAAHRVRVAAHRPRLHLHPHRPARPVPPDARQARVLPDGLGRQRAAHRAPRAELLRRPLRPVAPLRRRRSRRPPRAPRSRREAGDQRRSRAATSSSCASASPSRTSSSSRTVFRSLGLSVDWRRPTGPSATRPARLSQRAFLDNLARGEAYQAQAPSLWDVTFRTAVAQAELEDREQPGAYHALAFARPDGRRRGDRAPPGPSCCPRAWRSWRIPDDERYRDLVRQHRALPRLRRRGAGAWRTTSRSPTRAPASRWSARSAT